MILTNKYFEGIIMTKTKFHKNYDVFNAFLVSGADYEGIEIISFDSELSKKAKSFKNSKRQVTA